MTSTDWANEAGWAANHVASAAAERPATRSSSRAGPVWSWVGVRSMIKVTNALRRNHGRRLHQCACEPFSRRQALDRSAITVAQEHLALPNYIRDSVNE